MQVSSLEKISLAMVFILGVMLTYGMTVFGERDKAIELAETQLEQMKSISKSLKDQKNLMEGVSFTQAEVNGRLQDIEMDQAKSNMRFEDFKKELDKKGAHGFPSLSGYVQKSAVMEGSYITTSYIVGGKQKYLIRKKDGETISTETLKASGWKVVSNGRCNVQISNELEEHQITCMRPEIRQQAREVAEQGLDSALPMIEEMLIGEEL